MLKTLGIFWWIYAFAAILAVPVAAQNLLHRQYREGETLVYRMTGVNENWHYTIEAKGVVKKDAAGAFYEDYQWSHMTSEGNPLELGAGTTALHQRLSLDPGQNPTVPDLSKVDPKTIGPITDFMTFYSDLWLAIKTGQLAKAADHFYVPYGVPSSWADGNYVLLGQSSVDFDLTLKSVNQSEQTAVLVARHVPPAKSMIKQPASWMQAPVGDKPNNWVSVQKGQDGKFEAGVGEETFDVELTVSLKDGKILSGQMDNVVKTVERTCEDEALTKCSEPKPHTIERKIGIVLVQ